MLTGNEILRAGIVVVEPARVREYVQPNGMDLSVDALWVVASAGALGRSDEDRVLPARQALTPDGAGWWALRAGAYGLRFREEVALPTNRGGLAFPRSSLLRMGAHLPTAVWDAGYRGRAESLLIVTNPHGLRLQVGARVAQLVLFRLSGETTGYVGRYQGENLTTDSAQ